MLAQRKQDKKREIEIAGRNDVVFVLEEDIGYHAGKCGDRRDDKPRQACPLAVKNFERSQLKFAAVAQGIEIERNENG